MATNIQAHQGDKMSDLETLDLDWLRTSSLAAITITQAAQVLGVDKRTASHAIREGTLPSISVGRRIVVPRLLLLAMLGASPVDTDPHPQGGA
ncbi:helix-turn-helix domain-containing protein [Gordonia sp. NB41Y]|uniref:helix-turn-helix domain-containing protein n=1 Tax=Gordonia sp. NB41Y TaxID=875808 RepID=UPI0009E7E9CD|nr:helix-turn-helix domain-containing protein [Gordonia sp. NB41Y]WLP89948.1 helix-turn-helix domain-containing protein [Gordonia sp. NB41Y]